MDHNSTTKLTPHQLFERNHRPTTKKLNSQTELQILIANNKFLRSEEDEVLSWEDQLSKKLYDQYFREYCLANLKHAKSGNLSLRWRLEQEVVNNIGTRTCGSIRCEHHQPRVSSVSEEEVSEEEPLVDCILTTYQLPFSYKESGETKSALVKVVLCEKCSKKLTYSKRKEKKLERKERKMERNFEKEISKQVK